MLPVFLPAPAYQYSPGRQRNANCAGCYTHTDGDRRAKPVGQSIRNAKC